MILKSVIPCCLLLVSLVSSSDLETDYVNLEDFVVSEGVVEGNMTLMMEEEEDANGIDPENPGSAGADGDGGGVGAMELDEPKLKVEKKENGDIVITPVIPESEYLPAPMKPEETFTPMIIDDSGSGGNDSISSSNSTYIPGELPRPRFVMLGQQGVGKSSLANTLLGFDNLASLVDKKVRKALPFQIGHGLRSKTRKTSYSTGKWLGNGPNVTVVDTPGFKDTDDAEFVDEIMSVLGDEVKEVDSFLIVYKYKDRFTRPFKRTLSMITKMFGNFWTNVVLVVNFWSFKGTHEEEREARGVTMETYSEQLKEIFQSKFELDFELPVVFVDTHYNMSNPEELKAFTEQTSHLWKVSQNKKPFECLTRKDVQDNLKREKEDLATMRRNCRSTSKENQKLASELATQTKQIEAQMFVMTNLRNGIDYLKDHCSRSGDDNTNHVILGCQWSDWTGWSECTKTCGGGTVHRVREKLPGLGTCTGPAQEVTACQNEVCPLENDQESLVMVIGGETSVSRENEHSRSVEIIGAKGLCRLSGVPDLPEGRGKLCAAYDPSGAVIVCGGGERFWRPNANCWQLMSGLTSEWKEIPQMYPVHGAAVAFFLGKFWVLGGSTGDDSYDHTITDKVQAYNPRLQQWSVEAPLTSPRHKSCAVAVDDHLVVTGGTMLGLGKVKPVWLAEIGTRTAEKYDGKKWSSLPSLSRAKVEHGCSVATISGHRGVLVVGGATGDDLVEFLNWDSVAAADAAWKVLGKLNRGRGMMPGIGFIGGKLSIVGGYSWPGGVELIEEWDEDNEEWVKTNKKIKYPRYNHATLTVPGEMFPQCLKPDNI